MLCASTTNLYICFYFNFFFFCIVKKKKHSVALKGGKNDIECLGPLDDMGEWLAEGDMGGGGSRGQQMITDLYRERRMTSVCADIARMRLHRRIEFLWRVETWKHLCLFHLEHIEDYTSDPDIQDLRGEIIFYPMSYVTTATCPSTHAIYLSLSEQLTDEAVSRHYTCKWDQQQVLRVWQVRQEDRVKRSVL